MTSLIIALRRVLERCREANPDHRAIPPSGDMVMRWLLEELEAQVTTPTQAQIEALKRARTILANMAKENEGAIFNRWPINHEPLRNDAKNALPEIDAALTAAAQVGEQDRFDILTYNGKALEAATIERCAQAVECWHDDGGVIGAELAALAAAIRKLKDEA